MSFDFAPFAAALVRGAPDAIVFADADGVIRFWNAGAERIFGFGESEAVGQSLDLIVPANLRARHWEGYRRTMATGETRYGAGDLLAVPAQRKDGRRISVEFTVQLFRDASGKLAGIAAIMRDVTRQFEEMKSLRRQAGAQKPGKEPTP